MSLISIDQFSEFLEQNPEMEVCYDFDGKCPEVEDMILDHMCMQELRYDSDTKYAFGMGV